MKLKLFLFFCVLAIAPPLQSQTVDFSFNTVNGFYCNPQTVTFTQNCSGSPVGFIWDFGNGQSGSNAVETVIYTAPGTYSVTLTALYATNAISSTKTITINPTPTIALGANSNYLCQPGVINFTASGSAFITSYEWDFGDGTAMQITNANTISHNYTGYGSYTASVKGITSFSTKPLNIAIYLGFISSALSLLYIPYAIVSLVNNWAINGWASIIVTIAFFGGLQLMILGIIGLYLGRLFMQSKQRPHLMS